MSMAAHTLRHTHMHTHTLSGYVDSTMQPTAKITRMCAKEMNNKAKLIDRYEFLANAYQHSHILIPIRVAIVRLYLH